MKKREKTTNKKTILILGGGFGGVYAARHLEKLTKHCRDEIEIVLVNRDNYFVFHPMLAEIVGGSIGILDSVSALRELLPHTHIYVREISDIDITNQMVTLSPNFDHTDLRVHYDHLILALGNMTDFRNSPGGLHEHALSFKNLGDALKIRNRVIDVIETAAQESIPMVRKQLLTFVVGGGGFSGVEVVAEINDFARKLVKMYPTIDPKEISVYLIHSKDRLVYKELPPSLGKYCAKLLAKRGVQILFNKHLTSATPYEAILDDGVRIPSSTIVSTVPSTSNPLIEALPFEKIKGLILTDETLLVKGTKNIWALGDCAAVPAKTELKYCPPTAQFAVRQGRCLAENVFSTLTNKGPLKIFSFKTLGMMAALGHRRAVAEMFGCIKLSGLIAWVAWRFIYWIKLPGINRKMKVFLSWLLDFVIPQEPVQLKIEHRSGINHLHYVAGETIFHKGDVGDYLYIIAKGKVQVLEAKDGKEIPIAILEQGQYFGEMALLKEKRRSATVRCIEDCEVLAIRKQDFHLLITNFTHLREDFMRTESDRLAKYRDLLSSAGLTDHLDDYTLPPEKKAGNE
jgi:NADH dehydrogenase